MYRESSESRNATTGATSVSGSPKRPNGTFSNESWYIFGKASLHAFTPAVNAMGETTLTRMLSLAHSLAVTRESPRMASLAEA